MMMGWRAEREIEAVEVEAERAGLEPADGIEYVHHSKPTYGADDDARQFLQYENTLVINTTISDFDFPQTHSPMGILIINKYT